MPSDAAKRWVSPFFRSESAPNFARVWVLNPGVRDANVHAFWFEAVMGDLVVTDKREIHAGRADLFTCTEFVSHGWLRIVSDRPVVPWGTTSFRPVGELGHVTMDWYREEQLQLDLSHRVPRN